MSRAELGQARENIQGLRGARKAGNVDLLLGVGERSFDLELRADFED